jgi:hypothetical protein
MRDFKLHNRGAQGLQQLSPQRDTAHASPMARWRAWAAAAATAGAMALPSTAHACCNDFWSCGAAFVTGGLSCAIQAAQEESRRILDSARRALNDARRNYDTAVNGTQNKVTETRNKAQQDSRDSLGAMDAAKNSVQAKLNAPTRVVVAPLTAGTLPQARLTGGPLTGAQIAVAPQVGAAPAPQVGMVPGAAPALPALPTPPSPEEVRRAMEDALRTIDTLRQRGQSQDLPAVSQAIARMNDNVGRSMGNMQDIVRRSVFTPLEEILRVLGAADPTGLTNLIAAAVTGLDAAATALDTEVFRAMQSLDDVIVGALGEIEGHVGELVTRAGLAREIEAKVNALSEQPSQAKLNELRALIPSDPARILNASAIRGISGLNLSPMVRSSISLPKAAPAANSMKLALAPLSNQLKDPMLKTRLQPPADKAALKNRLDQYMGNEFAGLSGVQRAAKRQQLVDEARRRFASNPQQAQEMERVINAAAGPIVTAPATLQLPATGPMVLPQRNPALPQPIQR